MEILGSLGVKGSYLSRWPKQPVVFIDTYEAVENSG